MLSAIENSTILQLASILDLKAAAPLAQALLIRRGADLVVTADSVERIGAQCLQILLSARATWEADGHSFRVTGLSDHIVRTLDQLGVKPAALQFPEDISA